MRGTSLRDTVLKRAASLPRSGGWFSLSVLARYRHSVRARLMLWNMLTLAVILGLMGAVMGATVRSIMIASVDRDLEHRASLMRHRTFDTPPGQGGRPDPGPTPGPPGVVPGLNGFPDNPQDSPGSPGPPGAGQPPGGDRPGPDDGGGPGRPAGDDDRAAGIAGFSLKLRQPDAYRPRILDLQGNELAPTRGQGVWDPKAFKEAVEGREVYSDTTVSGEPLRVFSCPYPRHGPIAGVIQVPYPLSEVNRAMAGLDAALLTLIPLALLCAAAGGALLTNRALLPVRQVAHAASRIQARDLSERLTVAGQDEFWELAAAFNGMLERLEMAFEDKQQLVRKLEELVQQERRFTADASHELRTPLAVIKANTSLCLSANCPPETYRQSMEDINQAAGSMARLVQDLLLLARSDAGQLGQSRVSLSVRDLLERASSFIAFREGPAVKIDIDDPGSAVLGNEDEILRVFINLFENAARYTPVDGQITATASREDGRTTISVTDTGTGIEPEHLVHIGERFYRADASRSRPAGGSGLGLSICKSIIESHGGAIRFESTVGVGTTVHVTLPGAPDA